MTNQKPIIRMSSAGKCSRALSAKCETVKKYGNCPLNYNCNKPLTDECYEKCIKPLDSEEIDNG